MITGKSKNMFDLTGKVAFVTGTSSGIGAQVVVAYAEAGADVALVARRGDRLEKLAKEIEEKFGVRAIAVPCDVSDEEQVKAAVQKTLDTFGKIDILCNVAGTNAVGDTVNLPSAEWGRVLGTNLNGIFFTCKYILPGMLERKYGKIVNVASVNAIMADKDDWIQRPAYNASKAGVVGYTKALAAGYAKYGITANAIGPGLFRTEMTEPLWELPGYVDAHCVRNPSSRTAEPGDLNGAAIFLASDASNYVQGQLIIVDGGDQLQ